MKNYDHKKSEKKWQDKWAEAKVFRALDDSPKQKYYCLVEFPYPSGEGLHIGHVRSFTAMDIVTRKKRMEGFNVLYPMGWDAFGLPAENYAIKTGQHPSKIVEKNVAVFKKQCQSLGLGFDWEREVNTTDPEYYKWTQWIFLQLYKKGLAYKKKMPINWCPSCKIGLANEEVIDNKCERCGAETIKKELNQWMLKITEYADRLIEDLETVNYLDKIKTQQINWIGRSYGAEVDFKVKGANDSIRVFTTRPDTLFGATFLVLSPEHELVNKIITSEQEKEVLKYQDEAKHKSDLERTELQKEKSGVFTGAYAINPATGLEIPIWIADYVLSSYGTGAIMAVPAHDERDFAFAKKYSLPVKQVLAPLFQFTSGPDAVRPEKKTVRRKTAYVFLKHWSEDKYLCLDWSKFGWHSGIIGGVEESETFEQAADREIKEETGYQNFKFVRNLGGENHNNFFAAHKDENRYAVGQIMLYQLTNDEQKDVEVEEVKNHTTVWVAGKAMEKFLNMANFLYAWKIKQGTESDCFAGVGVAINSDFLDGLDTATAIQTMNKWLEEKGLGKKTANYHLRDWVFSRQHYWGEPIPMVNCEKCGWQPINEKELPLELPDVEKYEPTQTGESPLASIDSWVKTTCPNCGGPALRETDTMPNWAGSSWYFLRYIDPKNKERLADPEKLKNWMPVDLYNGGMEHTTLHLLYSRFWNKFLYDIDVVPTSEPYARRVSHGMILAPDGQKMSKSRGNVINPDQIVSEFGADVLRLYEMFMGPYDQPVAWDLNGVKGIKRFLDRIASFENWVEEDHYDVTSLLHRTIKKVTEDIDARRFNTAVSAFMIFMNKIQEKGCTKDAFKKFLKIIYPFVPHLVEELWADLGEKELVQLQEWQEYNDELATLQEVEIPVQINGKVRVKLSVAADILENDLKKLALANEIVQKYLEGKEPKKIIYVPGKLISLVI